MRKRANHPKEFKTRVAFEALEGERTIAQISSEYEVHSNLVRRWKQDLKDGMAEIFMRKNEREPDR